MTYQKLLYPMEYVGNSQGTDGGYSHKGKEALDTAGKDKSASKFYSSGVGIISYSDSNETWATYKNVIDRFHRKYPKISLGAYHSPLANGQKNGNKLDLWEWYSKEGILGRATGYHKHNLVTVNSPDWTYTSKYKPEDFLFLKRGLHKFKYNNSKYNHSWICDEKDTSKKQLKVNSDELRIRTAHNTSSKVLGFAERGYWNILETYNDGKYEWCCVYKGNGECLPMWIAHSPKWSAILDETPIIIEIEQIVFNYNVLVTGEYYLDLIKDEIVRVTIDEKEVFRFITPVSGEYYLDLKEKEVLDIIIKVLK